MADLGVKFAFGEVYKKDGTSGLEMAEYLYKQSALRDYREGARKVFALGCWWCGQSPGEGGSVARDVTRGNQLKQWAVEHGLNG